MGQTENYKLPYPEHTDIADIPKDFQVLAKAIESLLEETNLAIVPKRRISRTSIMQENG